MKKRMRWFSGVVWLFFVAVAAQAHEPDIEKKRSLSYTYNLGKNEGVTLANKFGDIRLKHWDRDQVKVDIVITASAHSAQKAEEFANLVQILTEEGGGEVSIRTQIDRNLTSFSRNISWNRNSEGKNQLRIDYTVYMPTNRELTIDAAFGDIYLPDYSGMVTIRQQYGSLYAEDIRHQNSRVDVQFGSANIKNMIGGKLKADYSKVMLETASGTEINNSFGKLSAKTLAHVTSSISYSSGAVGAIHDGGTFRFSFTNGFKLGQINQDTRQLVLDCRYSSVAMAAPANSQFDVSSKYGEVRFPSDRSINFSLKPTPDKVAPVKTYRGFFGQGSMPTRLIIKTEFGSVQIE